MIEQLDLDKLVFACSAATRCDEATARDALLDVLSGMWVNQSQYQDTFRSLYGLQQYLKLSTIRHLIRIHGKAIQMQPLDQETMAHQEQTPEEQLLALLAQQSGAQWLEQASQLMDSKETRAINKMLRLILKAPESYIRTRKTGKDTGHYAFQYSKLAKDLQWPRRQVYKRLEALRQALLSQSRTPHGEGS